MHRVSRPYFSRFNPRTRRGCDGKFTFFITLEHCFNPRTRRGCDYASASIYPITDPFQSTHPQGVRRPRFPVCHRQKQVSIHAPAGGATIIAVSAIALFHLFQSTHPQGVRPRTPATAPCPRTCFNPRTRRGCDVGSLGRLHTGEEVSIHAPAGGATRFHLP